MLQGFHRRDAKNIAFQFSGQVIVLEHDVERLIPRNIIENDSQCAVHIGIEHDVEAADLMNEPEEIFQINILQVDRDRLACVLRPCHRISLCRLRLLFGSQINRWSDGRSLVALRLSRMHTDREQFRSRFIRELRRCVLRASRRIVIRSYRFLLSLRLIRRFHEDVIVR